MSANSITAGSHLLRPTVHGDCRNCHLARNIDRAVFVSAIRARLHHVLAREGAGMLGLIAYLLPGYYEQLVMMAYARGQRGPC